MVSGENSADVIITDPASLCFAVEDDDSSEDDEPLSKKQSSEPPSVSTPTDLIS